MVLECLDDNVLDESNKARLSRTNIKVFASNVLEALAALYEDGFVHTGLIRSRVRSHFSRSELQMSNWITFFSTTTLERIALIM